MAVLFSGVRSVYWSSWVWSRCTSLNLLDEGGAGVVALEVGHVLGLRFEALRLHEVVQVGDGGLELLDDQRGLVHQPDFAGLVGLGAGEEGDGGIDGVLLAAEVEDVAVGLGGVEHAVGAAERLDQAVVLEVLVDVERVEVLGVEAGEEHVDDDGDVDLLPALLRQVGVGELLVLDALLHVLVVEVELVDAVVRAEALVVVGDDGGERLLLLLGVVLVVFLFLRQVFLNLLHVGAAVGRRREDGGDVERDEVRVGELAAVLDARRTRRSTRWRR